ncbi:HIT family protein [Marinactinospora rubrisoli]|uniref:HIT family protein n=1 Tax=Marinactinospora rubrisoli TaxID=2715399 RepID=A0ABW2KPU0_9ACTN
MSAVGCVFCRIAAGDPAEPATVIQEWPDALAIVPLGPVTPGHWLVIPRTHVRDAAERPEVTAATVYRAAELIGETGDDVNLIVNVGTAAGQTVDHLHVHIVPRKAGDSLALPWTR